MALRIVGISGSTRQANSEIMVKAALEAARRAVPDTETVFVTLRGKDIKGCANCRGCVKAGKCVLQDDWEACIRPLYDPMPNGVIFGAPVYFFSLSSQVRAYLERTTSLIKGRFFKEAKQKAPDWSRTVAACMAVGFDRNGGQEHAISSLQHYFLSNDFVVIGGTHVGYIGAPGWGLGGFALDAVRDDTEVGMKAAEILGIRTARTAQLIKRGYEAFGEEGRAWSPLR